MGNYIVESKVQRIINAAIESTKLTVKGYELTPGQVLLRQGEPQHFGYLIKSGTLRACHYGDEGNEFCKEYYFAGEFCFLYACWLTNSHADFQIEALTDATVVRLPLTLLETPSWQVVKMTLLTEQLLYKEAKEKFFLLNNPQQRYVHMAQHFPHWLTSLNDKQLAAYIGISPISLSRIKKRINQSEVVN